MQLSEQSDGGDKEQWTDKYLNDDQALFEKSRLLYFMLQKISYRIITDKKECQDTDSGERQRIA